MPRVTLTRKRKVRLSPGVEIMPGDNILPEAVWQRVREHPVTQLYLSRGELTVAAEPNRNYSSAPAIEDVVAPTPGPYQPESPPLPLLEVTEEPPHCAAEPQMPGDLAAATEVLGIPANLQAMRAREVIELVGDIDDDRRLRKLLTVETRRTVVRAIEQRIGAVRGVQ